MNIRWRAQSAAGLGIATRPSSVISQKIATIRIQGSTQTVRFVRRSHARLNETAPLLLVLGSGAQRVQHSRPVGTARDNTATDFHSQIRNSTAKSFSNRLRSIYSLRKLQGRLAPSTSENICGSENRVVKADRIRRVPVAFYRVRPAATGKAGRKPVGQGQSGAKSFRLPECGWGGESSRQIEPLNKPSVMMNVRNIRMAPREPLPRQRFFKRAISSSWDKTRRQRLACETDLGRNSIRRLVGKNERTAGLRKRDGDESTNSKQSSALSPWKESGEPDGDVEDFD